MSKVKLAIVEDEILVARDLSHRLINMGYDIIGNFQTYDEALAFVQTSTASIDLFIIDIELNGEFKGIDLAQEIKSHHNFPFIFLTSHSKNDVVERAKQTGPSAYLIKPFREKEIQIAIDLAIQNYGDAITNNDTEGKTAPATFMINDSFFIKKKFKYEKVRVEDILFAEAQRNYTLIKTEKDSYLLSQTLKVIVEKLTQPYFVQSHRSYLLNLLHITAFEGNRIFYNDLEVPVSKNYREMVFNRFQTL